MATKSGRLAWVQVLDNKVLGLATWTLSGFAREVIEEDSWDIDIKKKYFSVGDAGTITCSGLHDPANTTGQIELDSACLNSSAFTGAANSLNSDETLNFYVDASSYWTVGDGGQILITKCQSITAEKSAMVTVDFEAVVSGAAMIFI